MVRTRDETVRDLVMIEQTGVDPAEEGIFLFRDGEFCYQDQNGIFCLGLSAPLPLTKAAFMDDFYGSDIDYDIWQTVIQGGSGYVITSTEFIGGTAEIGLDTSNGNFTSLQFRRSGQTQEQILVSKNFVFRTRFRITNRTNSLYSWGFWDDDADNNDRVEFQIPAGSGAAHLFTDDSGTTTDVTTSFTPSVDTWYDLRIEMSSSEVEAFIDGSSVGSSTTNITPEMLYPDLSAQRTAGGGGFSAMFMDYVHWTQDRET